MSRKNLLKKIILFSSIPALVILIAFILAGTNFTKADYGQDFQTNGTVLVKYNGTDSSVVVPEGITKLDKYSFADNDLITNVILPDSLITIGNSAFSNCKNLKDIIIPDNVEVIEDSAFYNCINLDNLVIGKSLYKVGAGVFSNCSSLENVVIDEDNQFVSTDNKAIYNYDKTKLYAYLPGCKAASYEMPGNVKNISKYAFYGCDNLKYISVSSGLKEINDYAFFNMPNLEKVQLNIPNSKINIGAFQSCPKLKEVIMPESIVNIYSSSFDNANEELTFICSEYSYAYRFANENNIKTNNSSNIDDNSYIAENVINDYFMTENDNANIENNNKNNNQNITLNEKPEKELSNNLEKAEDYYKNIIANGKNVGGTPIVSDRAFVSLDDFTVNTGVSTTSFSSDISKVQDYAFYNNNLFEFNFDSLTKDISSIGKLSFARNKFNTIRIPEGVKTIGLGAFYHCDNLSEIVIPSSVNRIDAYAFEYTAFMNEFLNSGNDFLILGDGVLVKYNGDDANIVVPDGVKYISTNAFIDNENIISVEFPQSIVSLNDYSFNNCKNLSTIVNLDNSKISENTFYNCNLN